MQRQHRFQSNTNSSCEKHSTECETKLVNVPNATSTPQYQTRTMLIKGNRKTMPYQFYANGPTRSVT